DELGSPPLEQADAGVRRQVAGEGQLQVEHSVVFVGRVVGAQQLVEEALAGIGDPVDLLAPGGAAGRATLAAAGRQGPEGSQLARERPGERDGRGRRGGGGWRAPAWRARGAWSRASAG